VYGSKPRRGNAPFVAPIPLGYGSQPSVRHSFPPRRPGEPLDRCRGWANGAGEVARCTAGFSPPASGEILIVSDPSRSMQPTTTPVSRGLPARLSILSCTLRLAPPFLGLRPRPCHTDCNFGRRSDGERPATARKRSWSRLAEDAVCLFVRCPTARPSNGILIWR
jgi:hypothetical protein